MAREGGGGMAGRLALLISLIALVLSWQAYRRTGGTIPGLDRPLPEVRAEAEDGGTAAEARARLLARRAEIAAREDIASIRQEIEGIRRRLAGTYEGAERGVRDRWREADQALASLEQRLDQGGDQAQAALDQALDRLRNLRGSEAESAPTQTESTEP